MPNKLDFSVASAIQLTIVMPCLNEAETLAGCTEKARVGIERAGMRGAAVIKARGLSSGGSAANAVVDTVYSLINDTPRDEWHNVAVCSDESYGVEKGLISSFPVRVRRGDWEIVQGLPINEFSRAKIDASVAELKEERSLVSELL